VLFWYQPLCPVLNIHTHTHTHTHKCFELGMPKHINTHNELKNVKIKWPQLVVDKDIYKKHTRYTKQSY
jgi:hypothetical protein